MIGYVTLGTNDLARAAAFYDALLAEIGITRLMEFGSRGYGRAASMDKPMLCVFKPYDGRPATVGNGVMVGVAVELGGIDEGRHRPRRAGRPVLGCARPFPGSRRVLLLLSRAARSRRRVSGEGRQASVE